MLENFHCTKAFQILLDVDVINDEQFFTEGPINNTSNLRDSPYNILGNLSRDNFKRLRSSIVSTVLATDMSKHFEYVGRFRNKISGAGKSAQFS